MRMYVLLFFTAITLSFSTAYYAISMQKKTSAGLIEIKEIKQLKLEFEAKARAIFEIDLSAMYPSRRFSQLLQPQNVFSREVTGTKATFSKPCTENLEKMSKLYFDKSETWEDFRCHRLLKLPANFFENAPLIHESGVSYAFLAFLSGREPFYNSDWVRSNLNLFHVYELIELPVNALEGNFKILSTLNKVELEVLVKGSSRILTENYYLVRNENDLNFTYKIFSRVDLENFLKEKTYHLRPFDSTETCFYREDRFCWEKDNRTLVQLFMQSSIIVFSVSILVLVLIAAILFKKIRQQKFEEERKKHALRVLTHELRTPIANLMLQVERINKQSDIIPPIILEEFLKMEGEVYRLKRLAEKSTSYLQSHDGRSLLLMNLQEVASINDFLEDLLHEYSDRGVQVNPSFQDSTFKLDKYWFGICLKNLLENALHHGRAPITVSWIINSEGFTLKVVDSGVCAYKNLDDLLFSDKKESATMGLGLGMSIVQKIMKEMDGKLSYHPTPTTFSLFLRNKK